MLPLGDIISSHDISLDCYADYTQVYVLAKPDKRHHSYQIKDSVKDIRQWMLIHSFYFITNKADMQVLGPHAAGCKLSNYTFG